MLIGLAAGLAAGVGLVAAGVPQDSGIVGAADIVGGLWLDALQMTIVPLVFALVVNGVAASAEAARAGRVAGFALASFIVLLWLSSALGAATLSTLFALWPAPEGAAAALRAVSGAAAQAIPPTPPIGDFVRSIIPPNPVAAAASGALLPLIVFAGIFGIALARLQSETRKALTDVLAALADAMLTVIGWVMWIGPVGVFALALVAGVRGGTVIAGVLLHYAILLSSVGVVVWLTSFVVAAIGGQIGVGRFARASAPAQAVAVSTRSSVASLPAMLIGAGQLGVRAAIADIVLPMAVSIFRITGPAMNLAVALYIAYSFGLQLGPAQIAAGIAAASLTTLSAPGVAGEVSFFVSIAPICAAMGVPVAPLALLIAIEMVPDIFRTLGNVTMDVAVTALVARWTGGEAPEAGDS